MAVSFSGNAKAEICRSIPNHRGCALAQCFGILLFCNQFSFDGIRIITECREFAALLPKLFKKAFGLNFDVLPDQEAQGKQIFQFIQKDKIHRIMAAYGFAPEDTLSLHLNLAVVEEDCCKASFLRGAFLSGGSATDPTKSYHLELATTHHSVARECDTLVREVLGFAPKMANRSGGQVLYLKNSEQISDFLTCLSAPVAAMGIMEARLEKELNNRVNRQGGGGRSGTINCDSYLAREWHAGKLARKVKASGNSKRSASGLFLDGIGCHDGAGNF